MGHKLARFGAFLAHPLSSLLEAWLAKVVKTQV
jgi:hypothetical protein